MLNLRILLLLPLPEPLNLVILAGQQRLDHALVLLVFSVPLVLLLLLLLYLLDLLNVLLLLLQVASQEDFVLLDEDVVVSLE